jgi:hypothetical protein
MDQPLDSEQFEKGNSKKIYRGIFSSYLVDGEELPVGGSIFSEELTTKLKLDFAHFEHEFETTTPEKFAATYEENKEALIEWLNKIDAKVNPFIFAACMGVQKKVDKLLEVNREEKENPSNNARFEAYSSGKSPKLSELIGSSACAERAALGQYTFQKLGISTNYMSGISMLNPDDLDTSPENHSFLIIDHEGKNYIFDIARPRSGNNLPRVLEPVTPFNYDIFEGKDDLLIKTKEVLQGGELYFGVGTPTFGHRKVINEEREVHR